MINLVKILIVMSTASFLSCNWEKMRFHEQDSFINKFGTPDEVN